MEKNQCTYCDGLGHCPGCDGLGHARRFGCYICGGSGDCPECDGYGISFKSTEENEENRANKDDNKEVIRNETNGI